MRTQELKSSVPAIAISPIQWSRMKHIDTVEPLNAGDAACLADIRDVLKKHGKLDRLGVALLHSHFPLADDETMLEDTDDEARVQTLVPIKVSELGPTDMGTIWKLQEGTEMLAMGWCRQYCRRGAVINGGRHTRAHTKAK